MFSSNSFFSGGKPGRPLSRTVVAADLDATLPEIMAWFAGEEGKPLPSDERQRELQYWRDYMRQRAL